MSIARWITTLFIAAAVPSLATGQSTLTNGFFIDGVFNFVGEVDQYIFDARAGESFEIRAVDLMYGGPIDFDVRVIRPNGSTESIGQGTDVATISDVASVDGFYTVRVSDRNMTTYAPTYRIYFVKAPITDPEDTIVAGGVFNRRIDRGDLDAYRVPMRAGDTYEFRVFDASQGPLFPNLKLFDPTGGLVVSAGSNLTGGQIAFTTGVAATDGVYTLLVSDNGAMSPQLVNAGVGDYDLSVFLAPGPTEGGVLAPGASEFDAMDRGDVDSYGFLGTAGTSVQIDINFFGNFLSRIRVFEPDGSLLQQFDETGDVLVSVPLASNGLHSFVITDRTASLNLTPSYLISVVGADAPPATASNATLPAASSSDPVLTDSGGDPAIGPKLGDPREPLDFALDCSSASAPGPFAIFLALDQLPAAAPSPFGDFWLNGVIANVSGSHTRNTVQFIPGPDGVFVANSIDLLGLTLVGQGYCASGSSLGRLSNAQVQTVGL